MIDKLLSNVVLLILISVFLNVNMYSQTEIHGTLIDSTGFFIPGAQITERGTENGIASDPDGRFKLTVADTSKIRISMIGYYDTIMSPRELQGDTILMRIYPYIDDDPVYIDTYRRFFTFGLNGDVKYMPFGISFSYFKPYFLRKKILLSTGVAFKTNFRSDFDFGIYLNRYEVIQTHNYNLNIQAIYRNRSLNLNGRKLISQDFECITSNLFFGKIGLSPGLLYRNETFEKRETGFGFYSGIYWGFERIDQFWNIHMNTFKDYSEYGIFVSQGFSNLRYPFSRFRIGLHYSKYRYYNEFNIFALYSIN